MPTESIAAAPGGRGSPDDLAARAERWAAANGTTALVVLVGGRTVLDVRRPVSEAGVIGLDGDLRTGAAANGVLGLRFEPLAGGVMRHDVASAQKTPVAMLALAAVERGLLDLDDAITDHLGPGWSASRPAEEAEVTVRHALTMTSGLSDALVREAPPGTTWRYSLGPIWHQAKRVLMAVTGRSLQEVFDDWLGSPLGLADTRWISRPGIAYLDGEPVEALTTTAHDLARLGRVLAGGGTVDGVEVLPAARVAELCTPCQDLNPAYGLLTWRNGVAPILLPMVEGPVDRWLMPSGPADAVAMLGAMGQVCVASPSLDLVVVRLGGSTGGPGGGLGSAVAEELWHVLPAAGLADLTTGIAGG